MRSNCIIIGNTLQVRFNFFEFPQCFFKLTGHFNYNVAAGWRAAFGPINQLSTFGLRKAVQNFNSFKVFRWLECLYDHRANLVYQVLIFSYWVFCYSVVEIFFYLLPTGLCNILHDVPFLDFTLTMNLLRKLLT